MEGTRAPSPARGRRWPDEVGSDEGTLSLINLDPASVTFRHPTPADAGATPDHVQGRIFSRKREKECRAS